MKRLFLISALAATAIFSSVASASALNNGGFESGNLNYWNSLAVACDTVPAPTSAGASGGFVGASWWVHGPGSSLDSEFGGQLLQDPIGNWAATFIEGGPAWGVLHRLIKIPRKARYLTSKIEWINQATLSGVSAPARSATRRSTRGILLTGLWGRPTGKTLRCPTYAGPQYAQIDLLRAGASPRSLRKKDILARGWRAFPGRTNAGSYGWLENRIPVKSLRGKRVRLRVAVISTRDYLNLSLDRWAFRR
jgi:hypothetical protein